MIGSRSPTNVFVFLRAGCVCDNLLDHMYNTYLECTEECLRVQAADTAMIVCCFFSPPNHTTANVYQYLSEYLQTVQLALSCIDMATGRWKLKGVIVLKHVFTHVH